jgi:hypothetical protein
VGVGHIGAVPGLAGRAGQQQDHDVAGHSFGIYVFGIVSS